MFVVLAIVSLVVIYMVKLEIKRTRLSNQYKHIYGPTAYPIIGSALHFFGVTMENSFYKVNKYCREPITKLTVADHLKFFISDPDVAKDLLLNHDFLGRPFEMDFFCMKYGLMSAQYDVWKQFRRPLSMTVNQSAVLSMTPIFNRYIDELCDNLGSFIGAGTFNLTHVLVNFSTQQLSEALIGVKINEAESEGIFSAIDDAGAAAITRVFNPIYHPHLIYKYSSIAKKIDVARNQYARYISIIEDKRGPTSNKSKLFLDKLYEIEDQTDPLYQIKTHHNLKSMIAAGYETTALAIAYSILMLAMNPDVDQKLYQEIQTHYVNGRHIDHETVKKMAYLDMVVKEVLRLFPLVPYTARKSIVDTYIDQIGKIPKDIEILINFFKIHRSKKYWGPNPDKFDPENFTLERINERHPHCYIPFASGPRNCIGLNYANLNIRLALVRILSEYKFTTNLKYEDLRFTYAVVLRLASGHLIQIHKREMTDGEIKG